MSADQEAPIAAAHFVYFMVRLQRTDATHSAADLAGIVERIGSGEKRTFTSSAELVRVLDALAPPPAPATPDALAPPPRSEQLNAPRTE